MNYDQLLLRACHSNPGAALQEKLAEHKDWQIRWAWAKHNPPKPETQELFQKRIEKETRNEVLRTLVRSADPNQRKTLIKRGYCTEAFCSLHVKDEPSQEHLELLETLVKERKNSAKNVISANIRGMLAWIEKFEPADKEKALTILLKKANPQALLYVTRECTAAHLEPLTEKLLGLDWQKPQSKTILTALIQTIEPGHPDSRLTRVLPKLDSETRKMLQWWLEPDAEIDESRLPLWFITRRSAIGLKTPTGAEKTSTPLTEEEVIKAAEKDKYDPLAVKAWVETQEHITPKTAAAIIKRELEESALIRGSVRGRWVERMLDDINTRGIVPECLRKTDINEFTRETPELGNACYSLLLTLGCEFEVFKPLSFENFKTYAQQGPMVLALIEEIEKNQAQDVYNALEKIFNGTLGDLINALSILGPACANTGKAAQ